MTSQADFLEVCRRCVPESGRQGADYLDEHVLRFWTTFRVCERLIEDGASMISVGAGSAYVEHAIAHFKRASVTVIDFPEAIAAHAHDYARSNFKTIAHDLTQPIELPAAFDLALSCEIIEHLPQAPEKHLAMLSSWLKQGERPGRLVVTTPNLANLRNVMRLALMKPILAPPERFFGEVCYENEHVHRREYVPCEIASAFAECGLTHTHTYFTENSRPATLKDRLFALASKVSGRFSQTMILVGQG
jgi:2-polyprenyl-3-methyl-5-hydroxy-6-metoxy-1,4-benzoquinol methylase